MFFLNLSLGEFMALFAAASGLVTALYLLDRAKKKRTVSTLRFWVDARRVDEQRRRKRIREPWSLILQLVSLLLLLLAIAQLEWGSRARAARHHVLVLDTSSWMAERGGNGILLDQAKALARRYVSSLSGKDRVMLIRADSVATPATSFTSDYRQVMTAIDASTPSFTALNLASALELASHAIKWSDAAAGEIAFVGGKQVSRWDDVSATVPGLRFLPVEEDLANAGIQRLSVKHEAGGRETWSASVAVRNYSPRARTVTLRLRFASSEFAPRTVRLAGGQERTEEFKFITTGAGTLVATIAPSDNLPLDDQAQLQLPPSGHLRLAVFSNRPVTWKPFLEADAHIDPVYLPPSAYQPRPAADVILLDGFAPSSPPDVPSLWITPPDSHSPVPVAATANDTVITHWFTDSEAGAGLRSREIHLGKAQIYEQEASSQPVAGSERGPIVVTRAAANGRPRLALIGFDPLAGPIRYDVTMPLLFANLVRWLEPERFRESEFTAASVGTAIIPLDPSESGARFRVIDQAGFAVPFTIHGGALELYRGQPGVVRIISPERERVLSLTLPGVGEWEWKPPSTVPHSVPPAAWARPAAIDLWKWLAILGALGLVTEWILFGRQRGWRPVAARAGTEGGTQQPEELVHQ